MCVVPVLLVCFGYSTAACTVLGKYQVMGYAATAMHPWNGTFPWDQRLNVLRSVRAVKVPLFRN